MYHKRMKTKYPVLEEFVNGVFGGSENVGRDFSVAIVAIHAACHNKELQREALELYNVIKNKNIDELTELMYN